MVSEVVEKIENERLKSRPSSDNHKHIDEQSKSLWENYTKNAMGS